MRNFTLTLLACTALTFGTVACDEGTTIFPQDDTTVTDNGTDATGGETSEEVAVTAYYAVTVSDPAVYECSNNSGNHGADLDAVELIDAIGQTSEGYVTNAKATFGDGSTAGCTGDINTDNQDPTDVYGVPDGALSGGFVALGGGFINVEFDAREIVPAYEIQLHEVGEDECGNQGCKDDPMVVGISTTLDCAYPDATCYLQLSSEAIGDAVIPVAGN